MLALIIKDSWQFKALVEINREVTVTAWEPSIMVPKKTLTTQQ
jgi:hypothetical protein